MHRCNVSGSMCAQPPVRKVQSCPSWQMKRCSHHPGVGTLNAGSYQLLQQLVSSQLLWSQWCLYSLPCFYPASEHSAVHWGNTWLGIKNENSFICKGNKWLWVELGTSVSAAYQLSPMLVTAAPGCCLSLAGTIILPIKKVIFTCLQSFTETVKLVKTSWIVLMAVTMELIHYWPLWWEWDPTSYREQQDKTGRTTKSSVTICECLRLLPYSFLKSIIPSLVLMDLFLWLPSCWPAETQCRNF